LDENFSRLITTFDEVPLKATGAVTHANSPSVDLKRRPPKSLPAAPLSNTKPLSKPSPIEEAARKDPPSTFLFLPIHLSNSPGTERFPSPVCREADEA
jgi:hypothetical protein